MVWELQAVEFTEPFLDQFSLQLTNSKRTELASLQNQIPKMEKLPSAGFVFLKTQKFSFFLFQHNLPNSIDKSRNRLSTVIRDFEDGQ